MRKIAYILFVGVLAYASCFVSSAPAVVPPEVSAQGLGIATVTGKVESVSGECSSEGALATIVVVDKGGKKTSIEVKSDTVIYDEAGKTIALESVQKGANVTIEYREAKETVKKAESIELTE
jgi:hypothetical protein